MAGGQEKMAGIQGGHPHREQHGIATSKTLPLPSVPRRPGLDHILPPALTRSLAVPQPCPVEPPTHHQPWPLALPTPGCHKPPGAPSWRLRPPHLEALRCSPFLLISHILIPEAQRWLSMGAQLISLLTSRTLPYACP